MTDSAQDGSVCRHPVALPPIDKKASLHTCLKRRLKRFGVCNDEQRQQGVDREAKPEVYASLLHKRNQQEIRTLEEPRVSLESYLQTLPKLDPVHRTLVWVLCSDEGEEGEEVTEEHLHSLPIRGTIEPRKIVTPACSERGTEITSLSHCESDRGTNGRGTPPSRDENQQRLDYLCKRLQEKQQKALRMYLRHCGNLPYLPLSRNSKFPQLQPIEDAPEITPDIIPFLVTPLSSKNLDPEEPHCTNNVHSQPKSQYSVTCHWKSCNQRCRSQKELYIHIEEDHIADRDTMHEEQWVCLWQDCHANICHFSERYKLLSHVQAVHCREARMLAHHRSFPSVAKPVSRRNHTRRLSFTNDIVLDRVALQPLPSNSHSITAAKGAQKKGKVIAEVRQAEPHSLEQVTDCREVDPPLATACTSQRPLAAKWTRTKPLPLHR